MMKHNSKYLMKKYKIEFFKEKSEYSFVLAIGFKKLSTGFEIAIALGTWSFGFQVIEK